MQSVVPLDGSASEAEYLARPGGVIEVLRDALGERSAPLSWSEVLARRSFYRHTLDELRARSLAVGDDRLYLRQLRYFEARLEQLERAAAAARPPR